MKEKTFMTLIFIDNHYDKKSTYLYSAILYN
jgi:hypothetical protein